jgi:hypothetical protein
MQVTGVTLAQFAAVTAQVSDTRYEGNLMLSRDSHDNPSRVSRSTKRLTAHATIRLAPVDNRGAGTRTSAHSIFRNGRHGPYVCWHAHRDVFKAVLTEYPEAILQGGRYWTVTYTAATFDEVYPPTAWRNLGSEIMPVTMPELCECDWHIRETPWSRPRLLDQPASHPRTQCDTGTCGWAPWPNADLTHVLAGA